MTTKKVKKTKGEIIFYDFLSHWGKNDYLTERGASYGDLLFQSDMFFQKYVKSEPNGMEAEIPLVVSKEKIDKEKINNLKSIVENVIKTEFTAADHQVTEEPNWRGVKIVYVWGRSEMVGQKITYCGKKGKQEIEKKLLLEIENCSETINFRVLSPHSLDVVIKIVEKLGLKVNTVLSCKFQRDVPISKILEKAVYFYDRNSGKYYTEVWYKKDLVYRFGVYGGRFGDDYEVEGRRKISIAASSSDKPILVINEVEMEIQDRAWFMTSRMKKLRKKLREEEMAMREKEIKKCENKKNCDNEAEYEVTITSYRWNEKVFGKESREGKSFLICEKHLAKILEEEENNENLKVFYMPLSKRQKEIW